MNRGGDAACAAAAPRPRDPGSTNVAASPRSAAPANATALRRVRIASPAKIATRARPSAYPPCRFVQIRKSGGAATSKTVRPARAARSSSKSIGKRARVKSCGRSVHVISESASAKAVIAIANGEGGARQEKRANRDQRGSKKRNAGPSAAEVGGVERELTEPLADAVRLAGHGARKNIHPQELAVIDHPLRGREVPVRVGVAAGERHGDRERCRSEIERSDLPRAHCWSKPQMTRAGIGKIRIPPRSIAGSKTWGPSPRKSPS